MLKRFISNQARKPSGWFGRIVAKRIFDKGNDGLNSLMTDVVAAQNGESVLEIGFGCGNVICDIANKVGDGRVEGIDFSDAMLDVARKRNSHHMKTGRVQLTHGNFDMANYASACFDTVCSANTIYFWPDPAGTFTRIYDVLKPGGKVVLAFVDKVSMDTMPLDMDVFKPVSRESVEKMLEEAGFSTIQADQLEGDKIAFCVSGRKS